LNKTNASSVSKFLSWNFIEQGKQIAVNLKVISQLGEAGRWVCHGVTPFCMMAHSQYFVGHHASRQDLEIYSEVWD